MLLVAHGCSTLSGCRLASKSMSSLADLVTRIKTSHKVCRRVRYPQSWKTALVPTVQQASEESTHYSGVLKKKPPNNKAVLPLQNTPKVMFYSTLVHVCNAEFLW